MSNSFKEKLLKFQDTFYLPVHINDAIIEIIEITHDESWGVKYCPPHSHTWYEFNYIMEGSVQTVLGEDTYTVKNGEFFLVSPGVEHSHIYNPNNPHSGICIRWQINKNPEAETVFNISTYDFLYNLVKWKHGSIKDNFFIGELLNRMLDEAEAGFSSINLQLILIKILTVLSEVNLPASMTYDSVSNTRGKNIVRKVEKLLNDNIFSEVDVQTLSASLHMSYGYLSRVFKKETGYTIIDRLRSIRLEKAIKLLENTEYSVKEISEKTGFSTQHYFSQIFKETYGLSPTEYRKKLI